MTHQENTPLSGAFTLLSEPLQRAVSTAGYHTPSPIQEEAIPPLLQGRDLIGTAQTGTGKTAAFSLPMLQLMAAKDTRPKPKCPRALVVAPTRELAAQIADSLKTYGRNLRISHHVIFGGVGYQPQIQAVKRGVDILVATPGRLLDLMKQGHIDLGHIEFFVLDEVDRMLDMGFLPDIKRIIKTLPHDRHSLFFSATMPKPARDLASSLLRNPVQVDIAPEQLTVDRITQEVRFIDRANKQEHLVELLKQTGWHKTIVFTQMKHMANRVVERLTKAGIPAAAIHGNKSQAARTKALKDFTNDKVHVLVATDIAARGIDVDGVTHVVNFDLPNEAETYVHRIGRTARAGADGSAISFCSAREREFLHDIEQLIGREIPVVDDHDWHCENSRNAKGANARPEKKGGGGGGQRRRNGPPRRKGEVSNRPRRNASTGSRQGGGGRGGRRTRGK